jgi:threonine dehydrogenase-like Zn-dependent dehydrogenase
LTSRLGARVIAAAGDIDKLKIASEHGADDLVDYRTGSLRDRIKELTGEAGLDVAVPYATGNPAAVVKGPELTFQSDCRMSAFGCKADIRRTCCNVR